jgi:anti-anti-sigma regulatory factor
MGGRQRWSRLPLRISCPSKPGRPALTASLSSRARVTVDSFPHLRPVLHDAIVAAPTAGVVIDFTMAPYLDTSAIATVLEAATL